MSTLVIDKAKVIADALGRFAIALNADLEGDDPRAQRLNTIYEGTLAQAFNITSWNFLKATVKCDLIDKVANGVDAYHNWPNGYAYAHVIPSNKIGAIRKILSGNSSNSNIREFEIEGERLFTNCETVWISARFPKEPDMWPDAWREAFTILLAANYALPESHDETIREDFLTQVFGTPRERAQPGGMFGKLVAQDLAENPPNSPLRSGDPLTQAHGIGSSLPWHGRF